MKKLWGKYRAVIILFILWRLLLAIIESLAPSIWPLREGFLGPTRWANMDGVHYLSITQNGYFIYEQAFFPLYPNLIRWISSVTGVSTVAAALAISHISLLGGILFFYELARSINPRYATWSVVSLLLFPTSFFFASVYTESLFLFLAAVCLWASRRKLWLVAGVAGMLASNTRLFGIFLFPVVMWEYLKEAKRIRRWQDILSISLIPIGLIAYMWYLKDSIGDPLAFFHAQPAFGAGRSGGALITLPQVLWRYARILLTVSPVSLIYAVSVIELVTLVLGIWLTWIGLRKKILNTAYLFYALAILVTPTLTGTLSSLPRYILSAFPLFIVLGNMHNTKIKIMMATLFGLGLILMTAAYLQGYFVS